MFTFTKLEIPEVVLISPQVFTDQRGFLLETYKRSEFENAGIASEFVQDNLSRSSKETLRGLHYQMEPHAQGKLVRVVNGSVFDVIVDIRVGSPTHGKWVGETLSAENKLMIWVPVGFAHGFVALEDDSEILYKNTGEYNLAVARGIRWDDPAIGISWPIKNPILSEKDAQAPLLKEAENNFIYRGAK